MKIKATIVPSGIEFTLTAESEYEHAMLKFLATPAYEVKAAYHEAGERWPGWNPNEPTKTTLHLARKVNMEPV